jgi:hypothetical protein
MGLLLGCGRGGLGLGRCWVGGLLLLLLLLSGLGAGGCHAGQEFDGEPLFFEMRDRRGWGVEDVKRQSMDLRLLPVVR